MRRTGTVGRVGLRRYGTILLVGVLMLAAFASAAQAQELAPPKFTISAGYQFMNDPSWETYLKFGWVGAITYKLNEGTFVVAEGSGGYGDVPGTGGFKIERYAMLGGVKVMRPGYGPRIFVQLLGGLSRQAGDVGIQNGWIGQTGGGVEWPINERFNGRAGGDYRFLREEGKNYHGFRIHGALVFVLWR